MKTTRLIALASLVLLTAMQAQGYAQQAYVVPTGYLMQQPDGNMVMFAGGQYEDFQDGTACESDCCEPPCCEPPCCQPTCCEPTCGGYGCGESCGCPTWQFFGEFLYMRPRNAEVNFDTLYSVQPFIIDFDYKPAFRAGCSRAVSDCSSVGISYMYLYTDTSDVGFVPEQEVTIDATYSIDVDLVDIDYRRVFSCSELHTLTCLVGARYGSLSQKFSSQSAVPDWSTYLVGTDIDFEGGGIRVGLEGERYASNCGLMVYGRGAASFVAGEFRAHYEHGVVQDMESVDWKAGRIVTMLDLEVGVGWTSSNGLLRVTGGYMVSGWFNTVKTDKFIEAAEANNFVGLGDTLTFDGLTARAELRF